MAVYRIIKMHQEPGNKHPTPIIVERNPTSWAATLYGLRLIPREAWPTIIVTKSGDDEATVVQTWTAAEFDAYFGAE